MSPRFLRMNATTSADRFALTAAVRDAVSAAGGWITDFRQFSNVSVCVNFELESQHVQGLRRKLESCSLALTRESLQSLEEASRLLKNPPQVPRVPRVSSSPRLRLANCPISNWYRGFRAPA